MALNFPPNKNTGDTHTENGITFTWNGTVWKRANSGNSAGGGIPSGGIIIWSGASNAIPTDWYLCDGNNGTPDLRERFIVGAGGDNSTVSGTSGYNVNATGGENTVTLTVNQMPAHTHDIETGSNKDDDGSAVIHDETHNQSSDYLNAAKSRGGGQSHENRPPYYALCYIMKS